MTNIFRYLFAIYCMVYARERRGSSVVESPPRMQEEPGSIPASDATSDLFLLSLTKTPPGE